MRISYPPLRRNFALFDYWAGDVELSSRPFEQPSTTSSLLVTSLSRLFACLNSLRIAFFAEDIKIADLLLTQFCKWVGKVFGLKVVTPNMHMHLHLADCLQDFGPFHAFWLFSFERYNGLLGINNQPTTVPLSCNLLNVYWGIMPI